MKAEIQILTPVHIGSGQMLVRDVDFIIHENNIGILNQNEILRAIGNEHVSEWATAITAGKPVSDVINRFSAGTAMKELCDRFMPVYLQTRSVTQLRSFVKTLQQPYIPGSSLKGAIRTGLFSGEAQQKVKASADIVRKKPDGKWRFSDSTIQKRVFGEDPNHDILRFLRIGDASFSMEDLQVYEGMILNHKSGRNGGNWEYKPGLAMLYECLRPGSKAELTLSHADNHLRLAADKGLIRTIPEWMRTLRDALRTAHLRTTFLIDKEITEWTDQVSENGDNEKAEDYLELLKDLKSRVSGSGYGENRFLIRVGAHSGWNFTTGRWAFIQDDAIMPDDLYDEMLRQIQKRSYGDSYIVFPKTRKIMATDTLPGFVTITLHA